MYSRTKADGFSLIEVVLAVALVGGTLILVLGARNQAVRLTAQASHKLEALVVADEKLTALAVAGYPFAAGTSGSFQDHPLFTWRVSETAVSDSRLGRLRRIEVAASPQGQRKPLARLEVVIPEGP